MNFSEFKESLRAPSPCYLLITEQDYLKRRVLEESRKQIPEEALAFDWSVVDLEKDSVADLMGLLQTLPWIAPRRFVYVTNVEAAEKQLESYLLRPSERTVLILESRKMIPAARNFPVIQMPERHNPVGWVMQKARAEGYAVDPRAAERLVEMVGEDYQRLNAELEKQFLRQLDSRQISVESVLELTLEARHYDIFALIGALAEKRGDKALHILSRLWEGGITAPQIIALLHWNFRRLLAAREMIDQGHPYRSIVKELKIWSYKDKEREMRRYSPRRLINILVQLQQADRLCKSSSLDPRIHLERLIVDTCRGASV